MKKILMVACASILLAGLVGCKQDNTSQTQTVTPAAQTPATTQQATPNATQPSKHANGATTSAGVDQPTDAAKEIAKAKETATAKVNQAIKTNKK